MEAKSNNREKEVEDEILKRRISSHPLYGLLVENHLDCLKVSDIGNGDKNHGMDQQKQPDNKPSSSLLFHSELDHFMEAYCSALSKLKEAIEEPQQDSITFINNMHSQLRDLTVNRPSSTEPPTTSSGKRNN